MRALSASELLCAWERGLAQRPIERALTLLATTRPGTPLNDLARLSIGQRDADLLSLREQNFGPQLVGLANCTSCGERLELTFTVADLRVVPDIAAPAELSLSVGDYEVRFRLPDSFDLLAVTDSGDVMTARALLLERCLLRVISRGDETKAAGELPESVVDAVVERMAQADPQADVQLTLCCPLCRHEWQTAFDIVSFVWTEINVWAHRTLHDVHSLAAAYGWGEAEILNLSPRRRQVYLEMINR
jgi:hypothetical protein